MPVSSITVNVTARRRRKIRTWLYSNLLAVLYALDVIDEETATKYHNKYVMDSCQYRLDGGKWMPLYNSKGEIQCK